LRFGLQSDRSDAWMRRATWAATVVAAGGVLMILAFLVASVAPLIFSGEFFLLLVGPWRPFAEPGQYGVGPMIAGSLLLAVLAMALAFPISVGICCFAHGLAPRPLARVALAVVHWMTAVPTVIYGFVSVFLLVPLVRGALAAGTGFSVLAAAITLAVLIVPTVTLLIHVRLEQLGPDSSLTCRALGMSPAQTLRQVLLVQARPGLVAGAVLGFCRAVGDTLIALMVAGNAAQLPSSPTDSVRTLAAHVALVVATDWQSPAFRSIAAAAVLLFALTAVLTATVRRLQRPLSPRGCHAQGN
jgi:phosphate transport system permease protein